MHKKDEIPEKVHKLRRANIEKDRPIRILSLFKYYPDDPIVMANVEWQHDQDGTIPIPCTVNSEYLRANALDVYLSYLKSIILK